MGAIVPLHPGATEIPVGPFRGLPWQGYSILVADPPWSFSSNSVEAPGRNARRHYDTLTVDQIAAMPVAMLAAEQSACFLWITGPFLAIGAHVRVLEGWGFNVSSVAFTWVKLKKDRSVEQFSQKDLFVGTGFTTRKNCEFVVLGTRGKSLRQANDVLDVIVAPVRLHSQKPDEFYRRVEIYAGPKARRIDIFARQSRSGWETWGDQKEKFDGAKEA